MKREDFKKIIKLKSFWKIDRRKGSYKLPNGEQLFDYVESLIYKEIKNDKIAIRANGSLSDYEGGEWSKQEKKFLDFNFIGKDESCTYSEQEKRIKYLTREITG